jgi:hypothetical protein
MKQKGIAFRKMVITVPAVLAGTGTFIAFAVIAFALLRVCVAAAGDPGRDGGRRRAGTDDKVTPIRHCHLHLRRAKSSELFLGDASYHREHLAARIAL